MTEPAVTRPAADLPVAPLGPSDQTEYNVVIVGGGAAGLELATQLGDRFRRTKAGRVTLIDRVRTHLWKPLLHSVAAGSMDPSEHELDYLAQAYWHNFRYRFGEMIGIDRERKHVLMAPTYDEENRLITPARSIPYDTLVVAIGSITNDFGTPGVAEFAVPLETTEQAKRSTAGSSMPACAPIHSRSRSGPASSMSPSSAPARPAPSSPPSYTARYAK